ncbi:2-phospho-L-lactate guanylyltransferase [Halorubellus sp. PRR65]|uniref:2-phospho-L-lactate guanylyltransferase n=1 Tax=Halorubellus sp. PRR65 TaxID=3098148 RepID=UPI002B25B10C|nr:2-phospho-L-lactate guanylyltransferase [Halorubellus sp. PRR65]
MEVVVPFSPTDPKTRLSEVLAPAERREFAGVLLDDVLDALSRTRGVPEPSVLSTASLDRDVGVDVVVDERALTPAVNDVLASSAEPVAVVMADLALATPTALRRLFASDADVVLAPGRRVGTNALVARRPAFRVDYHGASFVDHQEAAAAAGATVSVVDSHRLATDVDEPGDLAEVLAHGAGAAADWLRDREFALAERDGAVHAVRRET